VALARQISAAQAREIASMSGWPTGWGEPVPAAGAGHHAMGGMGSGMSGMMSGEDMAALDGASGAAFSRLWLTGMVRHHTGAVEMARVELATGQNAAAKKLATDIIASQRAEIETMNKLLDATA